MAGLRSKHLEIHYNPLDETGELNAHNFQLRLLNPMGFDQAVQTWAKDERNLGGTLRTLDGMNGGEIEVPGEQHHMGSYPNKSVPVPVPDGLISRSGWAMVDDSQQPVLTDNGWPNDDPASKIGIFSVMALIIRLPWLMLPWFFGQQPLLPLWAYGYGTRHGPTCDQEIRGIGRFIHRRCPTVDDGHRYGLASTWLDGEQFVRPDQYPNLWPCSNGCTAKYSGGT